MENVDTLEQGSTDPRISSSMYWRRAGYEAVSYSLLARPPHIHFISGSGIGVVRSLAESSPGVPLSAKRISLWLAIFAFMTCASNFYAVVAIVYKAWSVSFSALQARPWLISILCRHHHRQLKSAGLAVQNGSISILAIVIESGVIYCVALVRLCNTKAS